LKTLERGVEVAISGEWDSFQVQCSLYDGSLL